MLQSYTIQTKKLSSLYETTVQEIGATITAPTEHDALVEACRAIHLVMTEEQKREKQGSTHEVGRLL